MEQFELKPIRFTRWTYFSLIVRLWFRRSGAAYGLFMIVGLAQLVFGDHVRSLDLLACLLLLLPFIKLSILFHWVQRADNAPVFDERRFTLDAVKIVGASSRGARSELPWPCILRWKRMGEYYLLYLAAGQMIVLERSAFPSEQAEQLFLGWVDAAVEKR